MGDPRKLRKKYSTPKQPWNKEKILEERKLMSAYGLKNKKEIYRIDKTVGKYKYIARKLVGKPPAERKAEEEKVLAKLTSLGVLKPNATLDDVLTLKNEDFLERRLQTFIWKKGFSATVKQARQLITHGYISLNGEKITVPSILVRQQDENLIGWHGNPIQITLKKQAIAVAKQEEAKEKAKKKDEENAKKAAEAKAKAAVAEVKPEEPAKEKPAKKKGRKKKEEPDEDIPKDHISKLEDKVLEKLDEKKK